MTTILRLFTTAFWKATATALLRTFIAGVTPFLLAYTAHQTVDMKYAVAQVSLLMVAAIFTSLRGIPTPDNATAAEVLMFRFLRQLFQYGSAAIATAVLITDVNWVTVISGMFISAISTILMGSVTVIPGEVVPAPSVPGSVTVNNYSGDTLPVDAQVEDAEADPSVVFTDEEPSEDEELRAAEEEAATEPSALIGGRHFA